MSTPANLKKIGLLMSGWHSSSGDPIYAVGSFFVSGKDYPDLDVVRRAEANLERDLAGAKKKLHGWGPAEVKELKAILAFLKKYVTEQSKKRGGGGARVTKAQLYEVGTAAFRKAYEAGANIPEAQRAAIDAETQLGGVRARVTLERVPLDAGGYTRQGRYFGTGAPLYSYDVWTMRGKNEEGFLRARDRAHALEQIYKLFPDLRPAKRK
jgi:hypothetical protein